MNNSTDNELLDLLDKIRKIGSNRAYMFEEAFISSKLNRRIAISSRWQGYSYAGSAADTAIGSIYVSLPSGAAPYDTYDVCVGNNHYTCSDADDIVNFIKSHVSQFDDMIIDDMKHSRRLYKSFAYMRQNGTCSHQINVYDNESTSDVYKKVLSGSQGITSSDKMAISRKGNARIARRLVRIAMELQEGRARTAASQRLSGDYGDIEVLFEGQVAFIVKRWNTFPHPIWVPDLKREIDEFKSKCVALIGAFAKALPYSQGLKMLAGYAGNDSFYEWEWRDQWIYTGSIMLFQPGEKQTVMGICRDNGIKTVDRNI